MIQLINNTFNYWTIIEARPNKLKSMVLARCVCGKEKILRFRSIMNNTSKSCGCKRKLYTRRGKRTEGSNTALNNLYSHYRTKAINKNISFDLSLEEFNKITLLNCFYCEAIPANLHKKKYDNYLYNGIDRINNAFGYTKNNIVPCCYECNTKKGAITKEMIFKLYEWFINENTQF